MPCRFSVTYRIFASSRDEALKRAAGVALEQTVEIPRDVVPAGYIEDEILGKVEEVGADSEATYRATVSYSPDSAADELPQLLNVIFGNSSIQKGLKVIALELGETMAARFPGARFGIDGLRRLANRPTGAFVCLVIKPQGSSASRLAEISRKCALAGADIIKEDYGLAGQHMAPFKERVAAIAAAVAEANGKTGGATLYFPNLAGHSKDLPELAKFAKEAGAHGLLVIPGLFGFDLIHRIARDDSLDMPVMSHPSFLGPHVLSKDTGFSHAMMLGTIQRLSGADISVFPNVGGRFGFSAEECMSIAEACTVTLGIGKPILPSPGGGMTVERASDMVSMYGKDAVYLLGGGLLPLRRPNRRRDQGS